MSIEAIDSTTAHARLKDEPGSIYLDVRSTGEFEQGHPEAAYNLPLLHFSSQGMLPNPDFDSVAEAVLPRDALIVVGCRSGQRSMMACETLLSLGFERVANVVGGFSGHIDTATQEVIESGWESCGLPVATEAQPGRSWVELQEKAKQES